MLTERSWGELDPGRAACVCAEHVQRLCVGVCVCVNALRTQALQAKKKKCSSLIACDLVEDLKGIILVYCGARESETKTGGKRGAGRAGAKEGRR